MDKIKRAMEVAVAQGGVLRLDQALECGMCRSSVDRYVRAGVWSRVMRGVYRVIDMDTADMRVRAAIAALPDAVATHETAAEVHAIPHLQRDLAVVTVPSRTTHVFPGVVVHRTNDLDPSHITEEDGFPVTTMTRTIVDLAGKLHPRHIEFIVDDLVAAKRLNLDDLGLLVEAIARRGKPGSRTLHGLLSDRAADDTGLASRLERLGLRVLADAGLPSPHTEYPAPWNANERIDAAYPSAKVGIEWDSKRWHTQVAAFQRDRKRDRFALLEGWRIFRFTWQDLTEVPYEVVSTIRSALSAPAPTQ